MSTYCAPFRPFFAIFLTAVASLGHTQTAQLPQPEATDPVKLKLMQGHPPPADKVITLATILKYPNARWAFHHLRELGPTVRDWRGDARPSPLTITPVDLDKLTLPTTDGTALTLAEWQRTTYTDGLLILHRGKVVYEKLHAGMAASEPHALWSLSKSITGLLATELIQDGTLSAEAPVSRYLPELKDTAWGDATVQQTLDMTTGALYSENFADPKSGIFQYLIAAGLVPTPAAYPGPRTVPDFLKTVKKHGEHGAAFGYKTVDTEVIGWLLQRVTGQSFTELMSERLWSPMGAEEDGYVWVDSAGTQITSIGVNATLRDLGRLGETLRQNGRFNGRQVLSSKTVAELRKGADPQKFEAAGMTARKGYSYHNHWWVAHDKDGTFEAKGLNGQHIHINPAAELVIVKLSSHPVHNTLFTHDLDRRAFLSIAQALRQK